MRLDVSTVLLQWASGGLFAGWLTTRRRVVGTGYGWLVRGVFGALAAGGTAAALASGDHGAGALLRIVGGVAMVVLVAVALVVSVYRRHVPVSDREHAYPPLLDLLAPTGGLLALLGAAAVLGGPYALSVTRLLVGALFLGLVTDAMLLGHWYLVQPGLSRSAIKELVRAAMWVWPLEVIVLLLPTGMISVLDGRINDGYAGLLGWTWVVSALTTVALVFVAYRALQEPYYSAVMAATGLLYLAILTAFGTDVLARALLAT
jgi:hypothetical protein